jgi:hypothetical protein
MMVRERSWKEDDGRKERAECDTIWGVWMRRNGKTLIGICRTPPASYCPSSRHTQLLPIKMCRLRTSSYRDDTITPKDGSARHAGPSHHKRGISISWNSFGSASRCRLLCSWLHPQANVTLLTGNDCADSRPLMVHVYPES